MTARTGPAPAGFSSGVSGPSRLRGLSRSSSAARSSLLGRDDRTTTRAARRGRGEDAARARRGRPVSGITSGSGEAADVTGEVRAARPRGSAARGAADRRGERSSPIVGDGDGAGAARSPAARRRPAPARGRRRGSGVAVPAQLGNAISARLGRVKSTVGRRRLADHERRRARRRRSGATAAATAGSGSTVGTTMGGSGDEGLGRGGAEVQLVRLRLHVGEGRRGARRP